MLMRLMRAMFFSIFRLWHNKGKVLIALLLVGILAAIYNIDGSHQSVSIYLYKAVGLLTMCMLLTSDV